MKNFSMILLTSTTLFSVTSFGDVSCQIRAVARCLCEASMAVDCGDGFAGMIDNNEKPTSITIAVFDKTTGQKKDIILNNPPEGVRDYYANLAGDSWVVRALGDKGVLINSNVQLDLDSAKFPDSLTLYSKENKTGPITKSQSKSATAFKDACYFQSEPSIAKSSSCNESICAGTAVCWEGNRFEGVTEVACKVLKGNVCPSASACAGDKSVSTSSPDDVNKGDFEDGLRQKSTH